MLTELNASKARDAVMAMRKAHGSANGFIAPTTDIKANAALHAAALELVEALGGDFAMFKTLPDHRLVTLCSIAFKSPAAAQRKLESFIGTGTQEIPVPTATPYDDSALVAELAKLQGRINELEAATPKVFQIGGHEAPKVTFKQAHHMLPVLLHFAVNRKLVFLVGEAGSGKTTAAEQVAEAMGLPFYMSAKVEDETALLGYVFGKHYVRTPFREAYEHGGVFLFDEIAASNPNAVNAFNAGLANGHCPFPDGLVKRHPDFYCIAADNTDGSGPTPRYPGRNVLDSATLDRFAKMTWDYDLDLERRLGAAQPGWTRYVQALRVMADSHSMAALITPRTTIDGGHMLSAGMDWDMVAQMYLWNRMSKEDARRLQAQVDAASYRTATAATMAA